MYGSTSKTEGGAGSDNYRIDFAGSATPTPAPGSSNAFNPLLFSRLCDTVTSNVYAIDKHSSTLEKSLKVIGGQGDSKAEREKVHVVQGTANGTVRGTAEELKHLETLLTATATTQLPNNGRAERNRKKKLASDFEKAVQRYNELQHEIVAKMKTTLLRTESFTPSLGEADDPSASLVEQEAQKQLQLQQLQEALEFEQGLLLEREETIRQIESDILDVNAIMKQIGTAVQEQGEVIETIEGHVETAYTEVDTGREELQKAAVYQAKYRKRLVCLLGTGFVVLIIVLIVLIVELKP